MEIINVRPRGYCQGVVRAILIAKKTRKENPDTKITILGMLVHNQYVVQECQNLGIDFVEDKKLTRLQLLDQIDEGIVIFSAHGVSEDVKQKAKAKGLILVDATCPDVIHTHHLVQEHVNHGDVIFIGKHFHPESEGTVGLSPRVHLVTNVEEAYALKQAHLENVLITNQTTLSIIDTQEIIQACLQIYPQAKVAKEICNATRMRQEAIMKLENVDLLIVVGDPYSNNTNQLVQIGLDHGIKHAIRINSIFDLKSEQLKNHQTIAVTSGSSTPNSLTDQVIQVLEDYAKTNVLTYPKQLDIRLL